MKPDASIKATAHYCEHDNRLVLYGMYVLICLITVMYIYLLNMSFSDSKLMPAWSDEYEYQKNLESFIGNGNLITSIALEENYAKLLGSSGHGFAYTLTNGMFARILGVTDKTIIYINFILIAFSSLAVWLTRFLNAREKLRIVASLLLYPAVIFYSFTYMMEIYQLFFGVIASLIIAGLYRRHLENKPLQNLLFLYYILIIFATVYRQTWALWGIAALPLARDKRQLAWYSTWFLLLLTYAYLFSSNFLAYYPYDPRFYIFKALKSGNLNQGFSIMTDNLLNNFKLFFSPHPSHSRMFIDFDYNFALRMLLLGLSLYFTVNGIARKNRHHLVAALVIWANIIPVFLLFTTDSSAVLRHLAPLYYFIVIYMVAIRNMTNHRVSTALLLAQLLLLVPVVAGTINEIKAKKLLSAFRDAKAERLSVIRTMLYEKIEDKTLATIYLPNEIPIDDSPILYSLPTKARNGAQLRYTMNPLGQNMKLWNKVPVSYILVPNNIMVIDKNTEYVAEAADFRLYRMLNIPENGLIGHLSMIKPN